MTEIESSKTEIHDHTQQATNVTDNWLPFNFDWQEYALFIFLGFLLLNEYFIFSDFRILPGPIYGGDLYYHYGHVMHIYDSKNPFASSHYFNEYEHYPWLTHFIISLVSYFSASPFKTYLYFPLLITLFSGIIAYLIGLKLFNDKSLALLLGMLFPVFSEMPSATPTSFAMTIMLPLLALALFYLNNIKSALIVGIIYGLTGIQHVVSFIGGSILIVLFFAYKILFEEKDRNLFDKLKPHLVLLSIIFLIGIPIAMLYWGPPIFHYKAKTPNNWQEYTGIGVQGLTPSYVFGVLKDNLFDTRSLSKFVISIFASVGLFYAFNKKALRIPILVFIAGLIGIMHPWITQPFVGISLGFYRFPIMLVFAKAALMVCGIALFIRQFKPQVMKLVIFSLSVILIISLSINFISIYKADKWAQIAKKEDDATRAMNNIAKWVVANTNASDVFLSPHGETAFAINALTGRKVVYMRITHSSPYINADERIADSAIILYGNSSEKRKELMGKYQIKYVFEDYYSAEAENSCLTVWDNLDKKPELAEFSYNCLRVSNNTYVDYLNQFGIETKKVHARLDIASERAPKFDIYAIKPKKGEFAVGLIKDEKIGQGSAARIMQILN